MAAAGSATITPVNLRPIKKVKVAWTSDASGNVNGGAAVTPDTYTGKILGIVTIPAGGGVQPTSYAVKLVDSDGVDQTLGNVTGRSITAQEAVQGTSLGFVVESTLELQISGAGNAKQGTAYIYIQ
jgi:tartrate dehydratase alpha subunit/fumarate hydratase class I-like protein